MKSITIVVFMYFLLVFGIISIKAQNGTVSSGGIATGAGGSVSYSVGQLVYTTNTGINGSLAQGVQQPYEISVFTAIEESENISLQFSVCPNPASDYLLLKIENNKTQDLIYYLFDINGELLIHKKITETKSRIDLQNFASSVYFLKIFDKKKEIKVFKIIKN
jgi:hypothetical protein